MDIYEERAKEIAKEALEDGQPLRYFNNLFAELADELTGKEFSFMGEKFNTHAEFIDFLESTIKWMKRDRHELEE